MEASVFLSRACPPLPFAHPSRSRALASSSPRGESRAFALDDHGARVTVNVTDPLVRRGTLFVDMVNKQHLNANHRSMKRANRLLYLHLASPLGLLTTNPFAAVVHSSGAFGFCNQRGPICLPSFRLGNAVGICSCNVWL